jgi:hypothetical protein
MTKGFKSRYRVIDSAYRYLQEGGQLNPDSRSCPTTLSSASHILGFLTHINAFASYNIHHLLNITMASVVYKVLIELTMTK